MGQSNSDAELRVSTSALQQWQEQESAFLADFIPIAAIGSDRAPRFPSGWWILPAIAASLLVWAGIFGLLV